MIDDADRILRTAAERLQGASQTEEQEAEVEDLVPFARRGTVEKYTGE